LAAHRGREVLRALAQRKPGDTLAVLEQEVADEGGSLLRDLAQEPADRLADPEFALAEHRRDDLGEQGEVALASTERVVLHEEGRPAHPDAAVAGPGAHAPAQSRSVAECRRDDRRGEPVDVRPARGRTHQPAEPGPVAL